MSKTKKHAAPLLCRLEVEFRGRSPSCAVYYCHIGNRGFGRRKCQGCEENIREAIRDGVDQAFKIMGEQSRSAAKAIEASAKAIEEAKT